MSPKSRVFSHQISDPHLRLETEFEEDIKHEVLFESKVNQLSGRQLFLGTAFKKKRFLVTGLIMICVCTLLVGRAAWMQIVNEPHYTQLADANRLRTTPLWPLRGIIRDRQGKILAENTSRFQVTLLPRDLPIESDQRELILGMAARLVGKSLQDLRVLADVKGSAKDEIAVVTDNVPYSQAMQVAVAIPELPGFRLEARPIRHYPWSSSVQSLSHLLGYVGRLSQDEYDEPGRTGYRKADEIGKTGLERSYETQLRGKLGERLDEVDSRGRIKSFVGQEAPLDGQDLSLTLDLELQTLSEQALKQGMEAAKTGRGSVVALDPRDGSVLALVSLPAYDNNLFAGSVSSTVYQALLENKDRPLFARAISGVYPSGSTVKIAVSVAALTEHIITPATIINSVGGIQVGQWFFPDWKAGGHGATNVRKAIAWSVNTFYYHVGGGYGSFQGMGVDKLAEWMRKFGLGTKTGIDLPAEASGFVPSRDWKKETKGVNWFIGDTYNLSIGQGDLLVTPLQVAQYTETIAMSGQRAMPHLVKMDQTTSTQVAGDASAYQEARLGMRDAVTLGSARALSNLPFAAAAKTGTAQWNSNANTHAWFTSFAPFDHPEIVVTVLLEEGGEGSTYAAPVAKRILEDWAKLKEKRGGTF